MLLLWISIVASLLASLAAKGLADALLTERIAVIGSFAGLQYATNPGVAFSIDLGSFQTPVILGALLCIAIVAFRTAKTTVSLIGYGMIIGGALGNIVDRLRDGVVTDFFQVSSFPIFNVADSCITVGVIVLLGESFLRKRENQ